MGRNPCCTKVGLNKGTWTALEDKTLADYIHLHGEGKWKLLPKNAGLKRCGKSCRLRWLNYLRPDIKRGNISEEEEELIVRLHKLLGNRWSLIAGRIPGRTDNEIKNYWNTNLSKKAALSPKSQMTKANSNNAINKMAVSPNSSVFRTRASRCSKVVVIQPPAAAAGVTNIISYEAFGSSDSNIVRNGWTDDVGLSCNNDQPAEGIMTGLAILMDDDLGLGDFFLSDFLNTDHHVQSIDNTHNENDLDFSGLMNWALDVDEEQMKQSMNIGGTGTDEDQNRQQFSGLI